MCASVGVKAKGESDQMMRNEGGGVFPESLMSPKWVFDAYFCKRQTPLLVTMNCRQNGCLTLTFVSVKHPFWWHEKFREYPPSGEVQITHHILLKNRCFTKRNNANLSWSFMSAIGSYDQNKDSPERSLERWTRCALSQSLKARSVGQSRKWNNPDSLPFSLKKKVVGSEA